MKILSVMRRALEAARRLTGLMSGRQPAVGQRTQLRLDRSKIGSKWCFPEPYGTLSSRTANNNLAERLLQGRPKRIASGRT